MRTQTLHTESHIPGTRAALSLTVAALLSTQVAHTNLRLGVYFRIGSLSTPHMTRT